MCEKFGWLIFNKETLRFADYYAFGYTDGVDNNDNTPAVTVGKCTRF